jgi:hypothetical protein
MVILSVVDTEDHRKRLVVSTVESLEIKAGVMNAVV